MPRSILLTLAVTLASCTVRAPAGSGDDTAPLLPQVCDPVVSGRWSASGSGFGMPMEALLSFDAESCAFQLYDWSMNHGTNATGGIVDVSEVTFVGNVDTNEYWQSCIGTLSDEGRAIRGTCSASERTDGGDFELLWVAEER